MRNKSGDFYLKKEKIIELKAFLSGKLIPIEEVNDGVFGDFFVV